MSGCDPGRTDDARVHVHASHGHACESANYLTADYGSVSHASVHVRARANVRGDG